MHGSAIPWPGLMDLSVEAETFAAKASTDRPVFGGCIGPFALAGRLLDLHKAILATRRDPQVVHAILGKATERMRRSGH